MLTDTEARRSFPNRGLIARFYAPESLQVGSMWRFAVDETNKFDPDNAYRDRYKVVGDPEPPTEILELGDSSDFDEVGLRATVEPRQTGSKTLRS